MSDNIVQILIAVFGLSATFLVAKKNKWGFVFGLISQPFWLITSFTHQQWGIFVLSIAYTFTWSYGIYQWFFAKEKKK